MTTLTIHQVKDKYQRKIMAIPGVVGIGIGAVEDEPVIKVLVVSKTEEVQKKIPQKLHGYKVDIQETGKIRAFNDE